MEVATGLYTGRSTLYSRFTPTHSAHRCTAAAAAAHRTSIFRSCNERRLEPTLCAPCSELCHSNSAGSISNLTILFWGRPFSASSRRYETWVVCYLGNYRKTSFRHQNNKLSSRVPSNGSWVEPKGVRQVESSTRNRKKGQQTKAGIIAEA